jgi:fatty acid desaturase
MTPKIPRIKFYGSQVGGKNVTPLSYTDSPAILLYHDIWSAVRLSPYLQYIIRPLWPWRSGELCELYPSRENLWSLFLHLILVFIQVAFIVSIPFWFLFFLPLATIILGVVVFWAVNQGICYILNGPRMEYRSDPRYATIKKEHEHEQWIFLNGVGVG